MKLLIWNTYYLKLKILRALFRIIVVITLIKQKYILINPHCLAKKE